MNKQCQGCGVPLQTENPNEIGYIKSLDQEYCVSCFRLKNYGDLSKVTQNKVDPFEMLEKVSQIDALFVWVVDLFHLEESKIGSLHRWFNDKEVVIMATKRELLPKTMSLSKIKNALQPFINESHLNIVDVLITGNFGKMNKDNNIRRLNSLKDEFRKDKIVFFGKTNVGKSSLINALSNTSDLSVSVLPGTTIDIVKVASDVEELYDSAGISMNETLLDKLSNETVKLLQQKKTIKPINFQLKDNQSLIVDGFGYIDFKHEGSYSITCYLPDSVKLHRTKTENVTQQFSRFESELRDEKLISKNHSISHKNTDIVIMDLGFITLHNPTVKISTHFKQSVEVILRKALL